jgi:hypothetical protein
MKIKGSFTIEASIIFPIVFLTIAGILYFGIYMHDKTFLQSVANEAALEFEYSIYRSTDYSQRLANGLYVYSPDDGKIASILNDYVITRTENKLLFGHGNSDLEINHNFEGVLFNKKVIITIEKPFNTGIPFVNKVLFGSGDINQISVMATSKLNNREEIVRTVDFVDDITSELTGVKDLKSAYDEKVEAITNAIISFIN